MVVHFRCEHCGCDRPGTALYQCPACSLQFCAVCGQALSVSDYTCCPGCGSMKRCHTVCIGSIAAGDDPD